MHLPMVLFGRQRYLALWIIIKYRPYQDTLLYKTFLVLSSDSSFGASSAHSAAKTAERRLFYQVHRTDCYNEKVMVLILHRP
jgi:hypothetical protein